MTFNGIIYLMMENISLFVFKKPNKMSYNKSIAGNKEHEQKWQSNHFAIFILPS